MSFEDLAFEYELTFGSHPPILTTLSVDNEEYLKLLRKAIDDEKPLTRNDLGAIFMTDDEAFY